MTQRNTARECLGWWWESGEPSVQVGSGLIIPSFTPASDQNLQPSFCKNLGPFSPTFFHTNNVHLLVTTHFCPPAIYLLLTRWIVYSLLKWLSPHLLAK